eukprot:517203-Lingulodinium_polyedra.AAC.1
MLGRVHDVHGRGPGVSKLPWTRCSQVAIQHGSIPRGSGGRSQKARDISPRAAPRSLGKQQ